MASIFSPLTKNIGIDLGTSTTQVYVEGRGIVLSEPSVMATDERNSKIIAVGRAAEDLLSRSPETVKLHRPLVHGVIADYSVTRTMLGYILSKCVRSVQRLRIMIGVPSAASNVEKRAVMEAVYQAGAKEAFLIETAAAAALGVNLPVYDPAAVRLMWPCCPWGASSFPSRSTWAALISMRPSKIICAISTISSRTIRLSRK